MFCADISSLCAVNCTSGQKAFFKNILGKAKFGISNSSCLCKTLISVHLKGIQILNAIQVNLVGYEQV